MSMMDSHKYRPKLLSRPSRAFESDRDPSKIHSFASGCHIKIDQAKRTSMVYPPCALAAIRPGKRRHRSRNPRGCIHRTQNPDRLVSRRLCLARADNSNEKTRDETISLQEEGVVPEQVGLDVWLSRMRKPARFELMVVIAQRREQLDQGMRPLGAEMPRMVRGAGN
ncbi:hypothetical protein PM082_020877 [Marasmius tenuissimus]|nr:hypothetical protein PM082_020877 [Marasmius tenuissimus]